MSWMGVDNHEAWITISSMANEIIKDQSILNGPISADTAVLVATQIYAANQSSEGDD